jgi:hypothetical protein
MSTPIDRDKLLSLGVLSRGRTRDTVTTARRAEDGTVDAGRPCKVTTDQLGHTVTESDNRQDVLIRAPRVATTLRQGEVWEQ